MDQRVVGGDAPYAPLSSVCTPTDVRNCTHTCEYTLSTHPHAHSEKRSLSLCVYVKDKEIERGTGREREREHAQESRFSMVTINRSGGGESDSVGKADKP